MAFVIVVLSYSFISCSYFVPGFLWVRDDKLIVFLAQCLSQWEYIVHAIEGNRQSPRKETISTEHGSNTRMQEKNLKQSPLQLLGTLEAVLPDGRGNPNMVTKVASKGIWSAQLQGLCYVGGRCHSPDTTLPPGQPCSNPLKYLFSR